MDDVARGRLAGTAAAESMRIIYGGSAKPENISELIAREDIDGGLIGGASLTASAFTDIVQSVAERKGVAQS